MPRMRLTAPRIAAFNPEAEDTLFDEDMPRLGLRARPGTKRHSKMFIFRGSLNYTSIKLTIGSADAWTIEAARDEARKYQRWIDEGRDPREVLKQEAAARAAEEAAIQAAAEAATAEAHRVALPALVTWDAYIEARTPKWGELSRRDHATVSKAGGEPITRGRKKGQGATSLPGALVPLLALPLNQIDAGQVNAWLEGEVKHRPTHAALAFRLLRAFLNWCDGRAEYAGLVCADACGRKVAREHLPKKAAKADCLQREQLALWFEHVRKIGNPVIAAYLQTALLTGARREEVAGLRWEDVDFQWKALSIKDKVEGLRVIPLTPYVAALLAGLPRRNEWVFSSPAAASGRLQEPRIQHNKALAAAGLPALTIHGLRRSFGTLAEWVECPAGIAAQIMGHKPSATAEKHYRQRPLDLLRMWHSKIEGWILDQAGIAQPTTEEKPRLHVVA